MSAVIPTAFAVDFHVPMPYANGASMNLAYEFDFTRAQPNNFVQSAWIDGKVSESFSEPIRSTVAEKAAAEAVAQAVQGVDLLKLPSVPANGSPGPLVMAMGEVSRFRYTFDGQERYVDLTDTNRAQLAPLAKAVVDYMQVAGDDS